MATKVLVENFHATNVVPTTPSNNDHSPNLFRLKVNKYGFRLEDIRVEVFVNQEKVFIPSTARTTPTSDNNNKNKIKPGVFGDKVRVKITAVRYYKANDKTETTTTREFEKFYDILARHQVDPASMRYDLDPKNPMFFIVQFTSHAPVDPESAGNANNLIYVNLDDSSESLVESAAKSLVQIGNIDALRQALEDPKSKTTRSLNEIFAPSLLSDIEQASRSTLTSINIVQPSPVVEEKGLAGGITKPIVRADIDIPASIRTASMNQFQVSEYQDNRLANHLNIKYRGAKLILDAVISNANGDDSSTSTSSFTKELNMPKGTRLNKLEYKLDLEKHSIRIEAPHSP